MENEINISSEQMNSLLKQFTKGTTNKDSLEKTLKSNLTPEQKEKVNSILSDPEKLRKILSSPEAKKLFNMMKDKKE